MASSNPTHVSNINDQHAVDATKLVASARNHLVYVESVVNTANVPQDAQEQVASRTLSWATQNQPHAKNNYLKFLGYTAMQGALHLLRTEIDLALNPDWRDTHEKIWAGVKDALHTPPAGSPMEQFRRVMVNTCRRATNLTFDPAEDYITLDMSDENLELVLSTDNCAPFTYTQAQYWLAHRIFLASGPDEANDACRAFQAVHPDKVISKLPEYTPRSLQIAKSEGIDALHQKMSVFFKPDTPRKTAVLKPPKNMPDDVFDSLASMGAFDSKKPPASDAQSVAPSEMIQALAERFGIPIVMMDAWKIEQDRSRPAIIKNFDFRIQKKSELGRAQYLLLGPSPEEDIRIELKNQTVSGSAGDKLPMSVYRLKNMHAQAAYAKTIVGVANTEFFSDDTLDLAKMLALSEPNMVFVLNDAVRTSLQNAMAGMNLRFGRGVAQAKEATTAAPPQSVMELLGMETPGAALAAVQLPTTHSTPVPITSDNDFGIE